MLNTKKFELKYFPLPDKKKKREYVIGEAFLKRLAVGENILKSLCNISPDPPDLAFYTDSEEKISIEVTEFLPFNQSSIVKGNRTVNSLRKNLKTLGVKACAPSLIGIYYPDGHCPSISEVTLMEIAVKIS